MTDIGRVDQLFQGIEPSDWEEQPDRRIKSSRSLFIPIGVRTLNAAFNEATFKGRLIRTKRITDLEVTDVWSKWNSNRGTVMNATRVLLTRIIKPEEPKPEVNQPGAVEDTVIILRERTVPPVYDLGQLNNNFSFDMSGVLNLPIGYGHSYHDYVAEFQEFMDVLEKFRDVAGKPQS